MRIGLVALYMVRFPSVFIVICTEIREFGKLDITFRQKSYQTKIYRKYWLSENEKVSCVLKERILEGLRSKDSLSPFLGVSQKLVTEVELLF